jgi:hypothetical protein
MAAAAEEVAEEVVLLAQAAQAAQAEAALGRLGRTAPHQPQEPQEPPIQAAEVAGAGLLPIQA